MGKEKNEKKSKAKKKKAAKKVSEGDETTTTPQASSPSPARSRSPSVERTKPHEETPTSITPLFRFHKDENDPLARGNISFLEWKIGKERQVKEEQRRKERKAKQEEELSKAIMAQRREETLQTQLKVVARIQSRKQAEHRRKEAARAKKPLLPSELWPWEQTATGISPKSRRLLSPDASAARAESSPLRLEQRRCGSSASHRPFQYTIPPLTLLSSAEL